MVNGKHGHLFFNDNEHIINNIRADPEYRGANAAIRQQLEAELQAIPIGDSQGIMCYCSCIYICCGWLFLGWKCAVASARSRFYICLLWLIGGNHGEWQTRAPVLQ
jgi:hypothetical protein